MKDAWKLEQYGKFKNQRAQPFWDLLNLTQAPQVESVIEGLRRTKRFLNNPIRY